MSVEELRKRAFEILKQSYSDEAARYLADRISEVEMERLIHDEKLKAKEGNTHAQQIVKRIEEERKSRGLGAGVEMNLDLFTKMKDKLIALGMEEADAREEVKNAMKNKMVKSQMGDAPEVVAQRLKRAFDVRKKLQEKKEAAEKKKAAARKGRR